MDRKVKLNNLGARIRQIRMEKGLTMAELGKSIKKRHQLIQRLETGGTNPSMYFLREIAAGLGVKLEELLKGLK